MARPPVDRKKTERVLPCGRKATTCGFIPQEEKLEELQKRLRAYLTSQGLKYSEQRWKIAEIILTSGGRGHLDTQSLLEKVKAEHPEIGAATVYRSIKVLCDASILRESWVDSQGRVIYELFDEDHHDHMICTDCGEVFEFHNDKIEALQEAMMKDQRFHEVKHRHVIYVQCDLVQKRV